ncbi:MAG: hypothetical protein P8X95_22655 [Anaerolineales bacterium]|jgi:hypothetical protein
MRTATKAAAWNSIYKLGGVAALGAVLVGLLEIIITFLPGGNVPQETVLDWFGLFQENWFMGLRNLGLLNILLNTLGILTYFALYAAHREDPNQPYAALATILSFLGIGIFLATNRAFPMFALSKQYASAATDAQRAVLEAAGQSMLSVGQSHTPGTFLGFFISEIAGVVISIVMLRSKIFGNVTALAGILGFGILLVFEFFSSFVSGLSNVTMTLAMFGGLLSMIWYILIARRLFQLGQNPIDRSQT